MEHLASVAALRGEGGGGGACASPSAEAAAREALGRLRVVRCPSSLQYLAALAAVAADCWAEPADEGGAALRLLVIDGVAAHYYTDRGSFAFPSCATGPAVSGLGLAWPRVHAAAAALLTRILRRRRLAVLVTKSTVMARGGRAGRGGGGGDEPPLSPAWQRLVSQRVTLEPLAGVPPSASGPPPSVHAGRAPVLIHAKWTPLSPPGPPFPHAGAPEFFWVDAAGAREEPGHVHAY